MEENEQDTLNTSTFSKSSWDGDENINKIIDVNKLEIATNVSEIEPKKMQRGAFGEKFILKDNTGNLFFAKEIHEVFKQCYNVPAYISLFSAFLSCFSHTPYPIGIKIINSKEYIIFRYDVAEKESSDNLQTNINNLKEHKPLDCNKLSTLTPSESENFNKLFIHVFFFNLQDRKFENLIFSKNGMHHIDLDFRNFMFDKVLKYQVDYLLQCGKKLAENCSDCAKYQEKAIRKIERIDYGKFIDRFIRNCIALNVQPKDAFDCLKKNLEQMQTSIKNKLELLSQQDIIERYQDNNWFKTLKQGLEKTEQVINSNKILKKIMSNDKMSNDEAEKWFTNKFQQKEKELKSSFQTEEQKENNNNLVNNDQQPSSTLITGNGREEKEVKKDNLLNNNIFDEHSSANKSENTYHIEKENKDNNNSVKDNQQLQNALIAQKHMLKLNNGNVEIQNNVESGSDNYGCSYYAEKCLSLFDCCSFGKNAG